MRKLGIIGGMSWSSTALYYDHINRGIAQRLGGFHSAPLAIESVDFAEMAALEIAGDWDAIAKIAIDAAQRLEASGAEGLLMACNTAHKCFDAVAANVGVPVLHIAEAAADRLAVDGRTRVALLGSRFTMSEGFIRDRIERRGIQVVPINGRFLVTWPRAVKGHAAAEPAITLMNARRCMRPSPSSKPRDDANQYLADWRATINVRFGS